MLCMVLWRGRKVCCTLLGLFLNVYKFVCSLPQEYRFSLCESGNLFIHLAFLYDAAL